ncbi:glycoside hydrolase family 97 catalytic domain-containing protein [Verrucomicrobiaceae bacterium N1E253]|uniref:Glycoside hydrolase family 97 catalytic domain-containing protein n=2 Tax=Oceaniferula marina TaxID=2748318 RepID=A0A851GIC7_9BACT|nr:glycoside hydrolase family 97 catalytic domain-containing protein [Oceaniferula marina]
MMLHLPLCANAAPADKALGLHSDGGAWKFYPAKAAVDGRTNVLLIGDSIMNGYRAKVIQSLKQTANVDCWLTPLHLKSPELLPDLKKVSAYRGYDVIHFNIGLHGWPKGRILNKNYPDLLRTYVRTLKQQAPKAQLIWASTTPVHARNTTQLHEEINPTIVTRNQLALKVMKEEGVAVNDLYGSTVQKLQWVRGDRFHWKRPAYDLMAKQIVQTIESTLKQQPGNAAEDPTAHTLHSPGQKAVVNLQLDSGVPHWVVKLNEKTILKPSPLGLVLKDKDFAAFRSVDFVTSEVNNTWKPVWGKASSVQNHYKQAIWTLEENGPKKRRLQIVLRAYDNGVAVRYRLPGSGQAQVLGDRCQFQFGGDFTCWSANGERANHGPVPLSQWKGSQLPLTVKVADDCYASILEAQIDQYAPISMKRLSPTSFQSQMGASSVTLPSDSSWRVVLLGESPGELLVNHTMVNLNPVCKIEDPSWIKPGISMWDWRAWGAKTEDGFTYNLGMESWKRHIDFAAKHQLAYLLLDAGWYGLEFDPKEDPTTSRDHLIIQPHPFKPHLVRKPAPKDWKHPVDVPALIKYAKSKNVGIILYLNDAAQKNHDLDKTLATYQQWGAAGIKYGFMRAKPQAKVLKTRKIVELCAKHQLLCDFHDGPIAPSGDRRTYPNYITREFCHSQSDAMRTFSPQTFCTTVFTNMLAGPLDMCNGLYSIDNAKQVRPKIFAELYSTVTAETARVLITYSAVSLLPDIPEAYEAKADLFEFIAKLPMNWDETRILHGEIGRLITTARRSGDDWFIATCCDEKGATLPIQLDFLKDGVSYDATLYEDGDDAHYKTNREAYKVRKRTVKKGDVIQAKLAPGGGHCIRLTPANR